MFFFVYVYTIKIKISYIYIYMSNFVRSNNDQFNPQLYNNKINKEEFSRVLSSLCTESYVSPEPPLEDKIYYA